MEIFTQESVSLRLNFGHDYVPETLGKNLFTISLFTYVFVYFHNAFKFNLIPWKTISEFVLFTEDLKDAQKLKQEIENLKFYVLNSTYNDLLSHFLHHEFESGICPKTFEKFIKSICGCLSSKQMKNYLELQIKDFGEIYRALLNLSPSEALTEVFNKSLLPQGGDRKHGLMGFDSLKSFLVKVQQETHLTDQCIKDRMELYRMRCKNATHLTRNWKNSFFFFQKRPGNLPLDFEWLCKLFIFSWKWCDRAWMLQGDAKEIGRFLSLRFCLENAKIRL